jgi:PAS domain S-box-containing protein
MHGRFLDVNDAYCQLIGYSRDELLTMSISDVEALERPEETTQHVQRIMETGGARFETRHRCKDGRLIDLEVSVNYTKIGNERLFVFLRDITERKRMEKALKGSEQRLADIIDFLPDATLVIDREGKVIAWNHAMEVMLGVKAKDMLGKGNCEYAIPFYGERRPILIDLVTQPQEEIDKRYAHMEKRPGGVLMGESYIPNLKGGEFYFFGAAAPLYDQKGNLVGAIECIRDITERKRMEEEREKLIRELQDALANIKTLHGLLPICSYCKKIRDDKGYWNRIESYIQDHSGAEFTHGMCPECLKKLYPDLVD